jgi:hypothetical protein
MYKKINLKKKQILKDKIKKTTFKKTWATRIYLSPRSQDKDNLIKKKIKKNNEVYFLKWTTLNYAIMKENNVKLC